MTATPEASRPPADQACARASAPLPSVLALDAALFTLSDWFCLDARNVRVPRVRPGSLTAALALIGQGQVTTVVGRLRPEVAVVDVDAGGAAGDAVRTALLSWCAERDLWALARASGGGLGRWHVFCLPGPHTADLQTRVEELRAQHRLPASAVDLRRQVRPLSAPHRAGAACALPGGLQAALRALQAALGQPSAAPPRQASTRRAPAAAPPAYTPTPRAARPLPEAWQHYLIRGELPAAAQGWTDRSSSTAERVATFWLVVAGHDEQTAWDAIDNAHPEAFSKARRRGRTWWRRYVWADAGQAADSWLTGRPARTVTGAAEAADSAPGAGVTQQATAAARAQLEQDWLSWGRDERHVLRVVLEALLDRMDRTDSTTVPCPERDLLLDTPLGSRTTVRKSLRRLTDLGYGQRLATFTPGGDQPDQQSHTFALDRRFTRSQGIAVRLLDPPKSHTPPPPLLQAPGLWRLLGLPARHTYQAVLRTPGLPTAALAASAGLVHQPGLEPTTAQLRTLDGHLRTLAALDLVQVDATGCWSSTLAPQLPLATAQAAQRAQQDTADSVASERTAYRERQRPDRRWSQQRETALAQAAKRDHARRRGWWDNLDPHERARRRAAHAGGFAALTVEQQARRKAELAERRRHAEADEETRRLAWIADQDADSYAERVAERTARFDALASPHQAAAAGAWQAHRERYGLSRRLPVRETSESSAAAPEDPLGQLLCQRP